MLSDQVERKFSHVYPVSDWLVQTDTGWKPITDIKQTVEYTVWTVLLENGVTLDCADDHIVFRPDYTEVFVKDLVSGDYILTESGPVAVTSILDSTKSVPMYDLSVDSPDHRYYTNGILSHNTTCAAGYLLWYAMFHPDKTILVAAHKLTGASEIMQRVRFGYEACPDFIRGGVVNYNKGSMEFDNGSRIISTTTTATTGRGMSISLLFCDEFAFLQSNIAEEFWTAVSPTLATGGKAIISSTPNTDEDMYATIWKGSQILHDEFGNKRVDGTGINGFYGIRIPWNEHPERDEKWKQEEIAKIGLSRFKSEHDCEFVTFEETLIDPILLSKLVGSDPILKMAQVRWYHKPTPGNLYLISLDPSLGTGSDYSAIQVFELPNFRQVAEWQHNITPIQTQVKILRDILKFILKEIGDDNANCIYWSCENNTVGEAALVVIRELDEESFPGTFVSEPIKKSTVRKYRKGFNTTYSTKISACSRLKYLIEENKLGISSIPLISELKSYVASGMSYKAKSGANDDLVSALLLIIRMSVVLSEWDPRVYNAVTHGEEDTELVIPMPIFVC